MDGAGVVKGLRITSSYTRAERAERCALRLALFSDGSFFTV